MMSPFKKGLLLLPVIVIAAVAVADGTTAQAPLDLSAPKTVCFIYHQGTRAATPFVGPDGRAIPLTRQRCAEINLEEQQTDSQAEQESQQQRARPITSPSPRSAANPNPITWGEMFQMQVERCWKKPYGGINEPNLRAAFTIRLKRDGTLDGTPVPSELEFTSPYRRVYQESALRAIVECQPYNLPAALFEEWKYFAPVFTERQSQPNQPPAAPQVDPSKQRIKDDLKIGYSTISFEDFALDYKSMVRDEKKVAVEGYYRKTGSIDELYASQSDSFSTVSAPASHILPLLIDDAPRDLRAYLLHCTERSPNMGCWTRVRGTVTMCSLTIFGNSVPKPCISVDGGWFSTN
jgi:hypothetical protein